MGQALTRSRRLRDLRKGRVPRTTENVMGAYGTKRLAMVARIRAGKCPVCGGINPQNCYLCRG